MKSLILAAHGSRLGISNAEVERLADRLRELMRDRGFRVRSAFLELAPPGIESAIRGEIADGSTEIVLLPYFLAAGRHVRDDVPALIGALRSEFPGVRFTLLPHFGGHDAIPGLLAEMVA